MEVTSYELLEMTLSIICNALHDLVSFLQFKKREKHPWRSVTFSKVTCLCAKRLICHIKHFKNGKHKKSLNKKMSSKVINNMLRKQINLLMYNVSKWSDTL